jgi:hypothetical protein
MDLSEYQFLAYDREVTTADSPNWQRVVALAFVMETDKHGDGDVKLYYVKMCGRWVPCYEVAKIREVRGG